MSDTMRGTRIGPRAIGVIIAVLGLASDQASKAWALATLQEGERRPVIAELFSLQLTRNSGAAFSLGASTTWIFTVLAVIIVIALVWGLTRTRSPRLAAAIGLLLGGALGNLVDRAIQPPSFGQGHVIDFLNYGGLFVGNVADIWIVAAAIWLAIEMILLPSDEDEHAAPSARASAAPEARR